MFETKNNRAFAEEDVFFRPAQMCMSCTKKIFTNTGERRQQQRQQHHQLHHHHQQQQHHHQHHHHQQQQQQPVCDKFLVITWLTIIGDVTSQQCGLVCPEKGYYTHPNPMIN